LAAAALATAGSETLSGPAREGLLGRVPLLFPLVVYSAMAGWAELLGVALRVRRQRGLEAATVVTLRAAGLAFVAIALWSRTGLAGLAWALALSALPPVGLAMAFLSRTDATPREVSRAETEADPGVRRTLRASFPLAINGGLAIMSLRIEVFALALFRGSREAGLFAAALKVVELMNMVPAAIAAGAMPALTREAARGWGPVRRRTAATTALLAAPAATGIVLLAPGLLRLLGEGYAPAATPLRVLAPAILALFMNTVLLHALVAAGRASRLPVLTALRVAAAVALALLLVPRLGPLGAAVGFLASELLLLVLAARACGTAGFEVPVARSLSAALGVTVPMAAVVAIAGAGPLASIVVGVLTYAATLAVARRVAPRLIAGLAPEATPGVHG
jgi:O-antigen/teichoic acid export membrane protein